MGCYVHSFFLLLVSYCVEGRYAILSSALFSEDIVCLSSVTFVRPTQAIEIFGNVSTLFGTLAIPDLSIKILRRLSQGNPSVGGVRGSRI